MFCPHCGRPTEDGQVMCPDCAAQRAPKETEVLTEDVQPAQNIPEQATFAVNTSMEEPPKKKKKGKLGWIIAGAIVLALALVVILCWPQISSFYNRTLLSPADYMVVVEKKNVENSSLLNTLVSSYGVYREGLGKTTGSGEVDISLNVSDDLTDMIESVLAGQGASVDLAWLNQILLELDSNVTGDGIALDVGIGLNSTRALTASILLDIANGTAYAGIPEMNDTYLSVDLEQTGLDAEAFSDMFTQMTSLSTELGKDLPAEEKVAEMLEKYIVLAFSQLEDVEKSTETVSVDSISQKFTVLETTISHEDAIKIAITLLKEAENDETLRQLVTALCDYVNEINSIQAEMYGGSSYDVDPDDLFDSIDDLVDELEDMDDFEDAELILTTYVDASDRICGRTLTSSEEDVEISYITVRNGSDFEFEFKAEDVIISGTGTEKEDSCNATYDLRVDGEDILAVELVDMNAAALADGKLEGTLRLLPGEMISDSISDAFGNSIVGTLLNSSNIALELQMGENAFEVGIVAGNKPLISLGAKTQTTDSATVEIPKDSTEVTGQYDLLSWVQELDFDQVIKSLEVIGVPSEYTALLESLSQQLAGINPIP